jgi:hypothetical protein
VAEARPVLADHPICATIDVWWFSYWNSLSVDYSIFDCDGEDLPSSTTVRRMWLYGEYFGSDEDGSIELFPTGTENIDGVIEGHASSTDPDDGEVSPVGITSEVMVIELEVDGSCGRIETSELNIHPVI